MFRQELAQLAFFQNFSDAHFDLLDSIAEPCRLAAGQMIFKQGDLAENLFILLEGEVNVHYKPYDGPALTVAHIPPGGVFGWSAVLARETYTSSAQAITNGEAYCISGCRLRAACEQNPDNAEILLESLTRVVNERLRTTHEHILAIINQGIAATGQC